MKKIILFAAALFLMNACTPKIPQYQKELSSFILFKTPTIKYADMGFVSKAKNETKVAIYSNGVALMELRFLPNQICLKNKGCMSANEFNKQFLHTNYPPNTLMHIFQGREIFNGKNKIIIKDGFMQKIGSITYKVQGNLIEFVDTIANIKIKVQPL